MIVPDSFEPVCCVLVFERKYCQRRQIHRSGSCAKAVAMQPFPAACQRYSRSSSTINLIDNACCRSVVSRTGPAVRTFKVTAADTANTAHDTLILNPAEIQPVNCLKEWAVTCAALGAGQQTILLRKGGIRELTFTPKATQFLMFPTSFHSEARLLKPGIAEQYQQEMHLEPRQMQHIPLAFFARITGAWTTTDPHVLQQLDPLHVYDEGFLEARLKWRSKEPLTLLELRCWVLQQPLQLPAREQYFGCFSFVELLPEDVGIEEAGAVAGTGAAAASQAGAWHLTPALPDADFTEKQAVLRQLLQQLDVQGLVL